MPPKTAAVACNVVLTTLLSISCAAKVDPAVCVWNLHIIDFSFFALNRFFIIVAQIFLAALNLAISSKKWLWLLKKKLILDEKSSTSSPFSIADSTYAIAFENVKANSCIAVDPASLIWYPETDIVFQFGNSLLQKSNISVTIFILGWGGYI